MNGSIVEADLGVVIDLPTGVTGGSLIHGEEGGFFPGDEATIDVRVIFNLDASPSSRTFAPILDLDSSITVTDFVTMLNTQLSTFETLNSLGNLGTFSFNAGTGQILLTAGDNPTLLSIDVEHFSISSFMAPEQLFNGSTSASISTEVSDVGEAYALVLHSEHRSIALTDISRWIRSPSHSRSTM